jgi:hypothetical protein
MGGGGGSAGMSSVNLQIAVDAEPAGCRKLRVIATKNSNLRNLLHLTFRNLLRLLFLLLQEKK